MSANVRRVSEGERLPTSDSGVVDKALAAFPFLLLMTFFGVVVRYASVPLANNDTYFHLRFGSEFLDGWSLRQPGSVTQFATREWVPTQWLTQMVMAKAEDWVGLAGVAWLFGTWLLALLVSIYVLVRLEGPPVVAVTVTVFTFIGMNSGISARPQVLSYVLAAVVTAAWLSSARDGRPRWWLVPLTWLWAMVHGMWPVSIAIAVATCAGLALERRLGLRLALVPVACAAAAAVTPVGPSLYGAVLMVGSRAEYFSEWQSPDFTAFQPLVVGLMLALLLTVRLRGSPIPWHEVALVVLAGMAAVYSSRTVPVAAVIVAPLLARALITLTPELRRTRIPRTEMLVVGLAAVISLAALALTTSRTSDEPPSDSAVVEARLDGLPQGTPVLNEWNFGGYLMWRHPQLHLVMHGYGDTFSDDELERNKAILQLDAGWRRKVSRLDTDYALFGTESRVVYALKQHGWEVVTRSDDVVLLRRLTSK